MSDNIKVFVKVRPLIPREIEDKLSFQWRVKNNTLYQLDQKDGRDFGQAYTFDKVYDQDTKTCDVYNDVAKPIVEAATAGFNGTIFAYGQTSSGKTYTMTGTEQSPGIIPLAVLNLFEIIKNIPDRDFLVRVSYIEIYNESLKDLLNLEKDNIKIHETLQGIKVDVTEKVTSSPEEVLDIMKKGEANRQTGSTNMNETSSRSHSIFQITIESREHIEGEEQVGCVNVSQLNLVDLAGSERAGQTGATGLRFKEGTHINKSLSALALVIKQLSEGPNKYANYRDSKLTRILQNSLGGNAKTSIICAVTLAAVEETISTLQFANRAKAIKNKPEVNAVATDATMIQGLTKELSKLQSQLESKKTVEQDNYNLQKQIAALQRLILNGFAQRRSIDFMDGARRKLQQQRRVTISTLHSIEDDPPPNIVKFRTPVLKYNPMSIPNPSEFVPIQNSGKLETLPEEPTSRLITPPPTERKVNFTDEVIELDSDDDDVGSNAPTCSPYHKCYDSSKTPPCILRKNAKQAEKNFHDIVELTEREKIYSPSVNELIQKIENYTTVITSLEEEVNNLSKKSKDKDLEMDQLKNKIKKTEEEVKSISTVKMELETQCNKYTTKLTDWEVSYETLLKKAKLREEDLLSMLDEKNNKYRNPENICKTVSRGLDKELSQFMDMSKDISLVNSDNESSIVNSGEEPSALIQDVISDLQTQLTLKNQNLLELESNLHAHKQKISSLENSTQELQEMVSKFQEKLEFVESENSLLKSTVESLNSTIHSQRVNIETANSDIESYNNVIQELQIQLTTKENILKLSISDNILESMIANEESIIANNENIRNIIYSFKNALDARSKEIDQLKSTIPNATECTTDNNSLKENIEAKTKQVISLNEEVQILKQQVTDNITTIENLLVDKNNLEVVERDLTIKLTDLEKNNKESILAFDNLKETYNKLLLDVQDKDLNEHKMASLNEDLMMKVEEMNSKINNLEKEITHKENVIVSLKKDDEITQNNLDKAKSSVIKLKEILAMLTDEIHEVPEVIDNFVFSALSDSLNNLETTVIRVITEKDEAVRKNKDLQNELTATMNKYNTESSSLHLQIDNLTENAKSFNEQNEILSKQLKELTSQLDQIRCEHSEKMEELVILKNKANVDHEDLSSKDKLIALLKNNECNLHSEIKTLQQNGKQKCEHFQKEIENLTISLKSNEEAFNEALSAKDKVITDLKLSFNGIETELKEKHRDIEIEFQNMLETSKGRDKLMTNILQKLTQITGDFHIENNLSCDFENMNENVYEQILLTLDKIVNHIKLIDSECGDTETNFENILMEAQKEIRELTQQNLKLMSLLSEMEDKNHVMSLQIESNQNENRSLKENLLESHNLLEQLKIELKNKVQEINSIEMKTRDWKEQFISLDQMMKQQIEEMQLENDQLKMKYLKLEMETTNRYNDPSDDLCSDPEYYQDKIKRKSFSNVDTTTETVSPPSLLTICCNTILDAIEPSETETKSVTPSSSNVHIEKQSVESQANICQCNNLLSELRTAKNENTRLLKIMAELEYVNQQLLREQIEVRDEVELLLAPVNELHKKLVNHKTNLSILTATSYAENKSLTSQVKVLQHHHSRYHNVCQRDIPAFKNQLLELMTILKREQTLMNIDNSNFKRYSLPDVLDNNTTLSNFKNESTLDGDILMLDTNVTVTTSADTTLMGHEQTCLDLTLYNEACCQTNDLNQTTDPNIVCSQVEILNSNYHNMLERLNVLKEENEKLRLQVHTNLYAQEPKIDAECSPIKIKVNSQITELNDSRNNIFICEKCSNVDEVQLKHDILKEELNTLSQELIAIRSQKAEIESKYQNIMLEMPSTDALVTKLQDLEKKYSIKLQENDKLTTILHNKTEEFKQLQEENDALSTQVMENISEADDLNKELDRLKELNAELTERCSKLVHSEKESVVENSCNQCAIKDDLINSLQTKNVPETHSKLNRSLSDSETSSRYNKICTLQNELDAGRADCKELTEEVATIKNHLERSNLSMDLDDSMGDSNIFGFKSFDAANSQYNKCTMPGIPEELPLDEYTVDKINCINYYVEKTDVEKESMDYNVKIIDVLKMLHNNLITKHANEVENLVNRLRDFEDSKNLLQLQINNMTSEYSKAKDELEGKDEYFTKIVNVLSIIKDNTNIVNNEILNNTDTDKTTKLMSTFKLNILKILDSNFGISCGQVFDSLIDSIVNKHQNELIDITDRYTKLQAHMESVTTDLNSVSDNLTQLKCQLSDKEKEYDLLKSQKERVHDINKAVTLDIIKKEQDLSEAITTGCQKLLELNIINPGDIDLTSPLNNNINLLFERLINQHKNTSNPDKEKELLAIEVKNSKSIIDEKQKELDEMKIRNEKMQEINSTVTLDLVDKETKLQTFKTLHEDLNKIYESKIEENKANLSLIENLTQEINILKETLAKKEAIAKSLESKIEAQGTERTSEKDEKVAELLNKVKTLQENLENLKGVNDMIIREKEISASELEKSSETIKRNKMDLEKMTSDILILRESVKENTTIIDNLKLEAKSLLKQNIELKEQFDIKCQECSRLETNIKTHEKTAEIQSKMIMRVQKQKEQDDKSKNKHLEELTEKWMQLQNDCDVLQNNFKALNNENEGLKLAKQSLEARVAELELEIQSGYKPRTSIDAIADTSRRRRQSLHDSKRLFADDKHEFEEQNNMDAVFGSRSKPDDIFMDVDDNVSDRSTPIRMSRGRDSLLSRTDQSEKEEEHPSRPSSVLATRRRRQSTHDLHRSVVRHTPSPHDSRLLEELNHLKAETGNDSDNSEVLQLKQQLSSCQQELEDLKEKYRELDDECETCAEYLRERDEQCIRLKKDKTSLESTVKELNEKLQSCNTNISRLGEKRPRVADVSVNTDEDWANLHSVVVDRMSFDAEVEKNKRLIKTIEELRFKNQELKNMMQKMQKALEKNSGRHNNRELEATKLELQSCKEDLEDLRQRYKELDEECETCAEYLRERDEQCRRLREAKLALEAKLEQMQEDDSVANILQSVRKKRQSTHDQNRTLSVDVTDATTETNDFLSYQVERDNSSQLIPPEAKSKEIKHLKMAVDKLSQQKAALENQVVSMSSAPKPLYVATGSAIVQSQQLTDVMKENQKLKKMNAKLINLCKKRGKDPNRENVDPSEQG